MPLGVFDCCSFLQNQYKLKRAYEKKKRIFCPSPGVHMFIARGDLSTAAALLTAGLLIPKCIVQRCFWLFTILYVRVFLRSLGISVTPSCCWCVFAEQTLVQVLPF